MIVRIKIQMTEYVVLNTLRCKFIFMETKKAADSLVIMTELVLPNDTNTFGNLMGGRLMYWMDIAAALAAMKHCGAPVVTASVDNISFEAPIKIGNVVHIEAKVSRAFNTSMEVHLAVWGKMQFINTNTKAMKLIILLLRLIQMASQDHVP